MTGSCTDADRERFLAVCREVTAAPQGEYSGGEEGIGVLREKRMHAAIKRFVCADSSYHEQRPVTLSDAASDGDEKNEKKQKNTSQTCSAAMRSMRYRRARSGR